MRHEAGVVDDHVDAAVRLHSAIHQALDLLARSDVGLNDSVLAERQLLGERLKPVETARAQHELGAALGEMSGGGLAEPAARAGDDDDFILDAFCHDQFPFQRAERDLARAAA